jgi:hypothetical protein
MKGTGVPSDMPIFKEGDTEVTAFSSEVMNVLSVVCQALRHMEIDGYEAVWSEGKVIFKKTDKTRTPETTTTTGGGSLPVWLP